MKPPIFHELVIPTDEEPDDGNEVFVQVDIDGLFEILGCLATARAEVVPQYQPFVWTEFPVRFTYEP